MSKFFLFILVVSLLGSCSNERFVKDVEKFINQQITFSFNEWDVVWNGKDTSLSDITKVPVKLVVWYDSLICNSCQLNRMYNWYDITDYADSMSQWFSVVFLFTPKKEDTNKVHSKLLTEKFDYPVFTDLNAIFYERNPIIPKNKQLHSFLLDKNNRIVLVGSPLYNPELWALYKRIIQKMIDNDGVLPDR